MIVFWRLFLSLYLADFFLFYKILKIQRENRTRATLIRTGVFLVAALWLCRHYLLLEWPFFGAVDLPGWVCILLFGAFYASVYQWFNFDGKMRWGYTLTFVCKNALLWLFLFLCTPFLVVYQTGNFFAQPWMIFCVGIVIVTCLTQWLLSSWEQDIYGERIPSFDEQWMMMMVRLIFFLIMLLPGVRWVVLFVVWLSTCLYARKIRLMDVANFIFYVSVVVATLVGLLVRLRFYWIS